MTALSLTPQQISVSLENKEGELRLDSRIVADGFGLKNHKDYRNQVLEKYEATFAELRVVLKTTLSSGEGCMVLESRPSKLRWYPSA